MHLQRPAADSQAGGRGRAPSRDICRQVLRRAGGFSLADIVLVASGIGDAEARPRPIVILLGVGALNDGLREAAGRRGATSIHGVRRQSGAQTPTLQSRCRQDRDQKGGRGGPPRTMAVDAARLTGSRRWAAAEGAATATERMYGPSAPTSCRFPSETFEESTNALKSPVSTLGTFRERVAVTPGRLTTSWPSPAVGW